MKVAVMVLTPWVLYQRHRVATFGTAQPTGTRLQLFGLTAIQKGMEKGWRLYEVVASRGFRLYFCIPTLALKVQKSGFP